MHKNNKHKSGYDFEVLVKAYPELNPFVFENTHGTLTIDFADPKAVKLLNSALLKVHYNIEFWEFPDQHLCPPIPGRADYIHHLGNLIKPNKLKNEITVLDVGTGATCIYPLLGNTLNKWNFVASEVGTDSIKTAQQIVDKNGLATEIELRLQHDKTQILIGIIEPSDKFILSLCNPPFYKSEEEAQEATIRKLKGLGNDSTKPVRNFSGTANELWFVGGEKAFLHSYLYESSLFKDSCMWYTSLVSNKDLLKSMQKSLKKLGATQVKVINMQLGNKMSRIVAWTFLTVKQMEEFEKS